MRSFARFALPACILCALAPFARSGERPSLTLSVGRLEALEADTLGELGLEYRFRNWRWNLTPLVGGLLIERGGSYLYGGLRYEHSFSSRGYLAASFAAGAYEEGRGKDLGGELEFRSLVEIGTSLGQRSRLGLGFSHISNASLYSHNGGTETLELRYTFDL